jgi:hypothetical protein
MVMIKSMDYTKKWVIGFGTLPFIVCSILLGSLVPNIQVAFIALLSYFISTIFYQKLIATAPQDKQKLRFGVFFILPIIISIGVMYI